MIKTFIDGTAVYIINPTPTVEIKRVKNNIPTVIDYDGRDYIYRPKDQFKGRKK